MKKGAAGELVGLELRPAAHAHVQGDALPKMEIGVAAEPAAAAAAQAHGPYGEGGAVLCRPDITASHGFAEGPGFCRLSQVLDVEP